MILRLFLSPISDDGIIKNVTCIWNFMPMVDLMRKCCNNNNNVTDVDQLSSSQFSFLRLRLMLHTPRNVNLSLSPRYHLVLSNSYSLSLLFFSPLHFNVNETNKEIFVIRNTFRVVRVLIVSFKTA